MGRSGLAKRALIWDACWWVGVRARRFVGRLERGSEEVGIDSGIGSDILEEREMVGLEGLVGLRFWYFEARVWIGRNLGWLRDSLGF